MNRLILLVLAVVTAMATCLSDGADQSIISGSAATETQTESSGSLAVVVPGIPLDGRGGGLIAFENEANSDYDFEVWIMNADGSAQTRLTDSPGYDGSPSFSPDGKQIVFVSTRGGSAQLYLLDLNGILGLKGSASLAILPEPRQLTASGMNYYPAWAPDNSGIAFASLREGQFWIYMMNTDGSDPRRLLDLPDACTPAWSPDARRIAFVAGQDQEQEIFICAADGSDPRALTDNGTSDNMPSWSPDGTRIMFSHDSPGTSYDIQIMNDDGSGQTTLVSGSGLDEFPKFSPDGLSITFRSGNQVWVMNADGSGQHALTSLRGFSVPYDWHCEPDSGKPVDVSGTVASPVSQSVGTPEADRDADVIAYALTSPDGSSALYTVAADGSGKALLARFTGRALNPVWSPDGLIIAYYEHTDDRQWSLWIMNADGAGERRLTGTPNRLDWSPAWAPDGRSIMFTRSTMEPAWRSELWTVTLDGGQSRVGTVEGQGAQWSPDGTEIAWFDYVEGGGDIWITKPDGSKARRLTDHPAEDWWPAWSPDGRKLAFQSRRDGNFEIYAINADGSGMMRLTTNGADDEEPKWSPSGGRIAFSSLRDGHYEVYVMNADGSNQRRLTESDGYAINPSWRPGRNSD